MQSIVATIGSTPAAILVAALIGIVPAVFWLFFWLREDESGSRQPTGLVALTFIAGMLSVMLVVPLEKFIGSLSLDHTTLVTLWAASEELFKYLAFTLIMYKSVYLDKPVDYPIYLMTAGLGFAALENTLYLFHPVSVDATTVSFLTGNLRYLGSTLLHAVGSGIIGISIGLAFFQPKIVRTFYAAIGVCSAIALHSVFNFFIMQKDGENFLQVFGFLWVVTIIIMLLFEKLRRMGSYVEDTGPQAQQI